MNEGENKTYPNLAGDDWFVRDVVKYELNAKISEIATFLIKNNIDYEEDVTGVSKAITEYLNTTEFTHDELEYVIINIQVFTAIQELREDGLIELTEDGQYRLLK